MDSIDIDSLKGKALTDLAKEVNLRGRSKMKAGELRAALRNMQGRLVGEPEGPKLKAPKPTDPERSENPTEALKNTPAKRNWHSFRREFCKMTGVSVVEAGRLAGKGGEYHNLYLKYRDDDNYELQAPNLDAEPPKTEEA